MSTLKELSFAAILTKHSAALPPPVVDMLRDLLTMISGQSRELESLLAHGLIAVDNFDWQKISYTTNAVANTEDTIAHNLKRIPEGFLVITKNKAADLYAGASAWTSTNFYLKCSAASAAVTIYVF